MDKNPFWDFSLTHYAKAPVQALCLILQDEAQANVNLLLFALWLAEEKRVFEPAVIDADETFKQWRQQVVVPLRQSRMAVKQLQGRSSIYEKLKRCELAVERVEQDLLFDMQLKFPRAEGVTDDVQLAAENLRDYLATLPLVMTRREEVVSELLGAVF